MERIKRMIIMLILVPSVFYFVYWVPFALFPAFKQIWLHIIIALICTLGVAWYVWESLRDSGDSLITHMLVRAIVYGAIGFSMGFVGPLIFTPNSAQGPLLGILITGPAGSLIGIIAGIYHWYNRT